MTEVVASADFFARQAQNRRRSFLLIASFLLFFLVLGFGVDVTWIGFLGGGVPWPIATTVAVSLATLLSAEAYFRGSRLVMFSLCAEPLNLDDPQQRELQNIVTEMAIAAGLPMPQLFLIPDPAPNALASGRDPRHAVLGVTEGLLQLMDREEIQGVVAHEMSHIANRDTLTMTLVGVLFGGAVMLSDWARRTMSLPSEERRGGPLLFVLVVVLIAITPLASRLLAMAVSRQREYLADATAAQLTRNPLGLAHALEKIGATTSPLRGATRGTAHLFISNPWPRRVDEREGRLADLLSSHPPLTQRIAILKQMAHSGYGTAASSSSPS
ncbi:MAG TPA: M48 family metallopeptidase [Candidatus Acidoferrales bacterium]|nr:M48 family metallopeptidase [Candidatus Acidoferrales bacterium]